MCSEPELLKGEMKAISKSLPSYKKCGQACSDSKYTETELEGEPINFERCSYYTICYNRYHTGC